MKILIQCAGRKEPFAQSLMCEGQQLEFVAKPELKPGSRTPWDVLPHSQQYSWIDYVKAINKQDQSTFQSDFGDISYDGLSKAGDLYLHSIYSELTNDFGYESVFILSAGWGLVRSDQLLPTYDVTFSQVKKEHRYKQVSPNKRAQFETIESTMPGQDDIHMFLTPRYVEYLNRAFNHLLERAVFHWREGQVAPASSTNVIFHDCGDQRTNWHYTAASQFLDTL